jgi:hypothetical protein
VVEDWHNAERAAFSHRLGFHKAVQRTDGRLGSVLYGLVQYPPSPRPSGGSLIISPTPRPWYSLPGPITFSPSNSPSASSDAPRFWIDSRCLLLVYDEFNTASTLDRLPDEFHWLTTLSLMPCFSHRISGLAPQTRQSFVVAAAKSAPSRPMPTDTLLMPRQYRDHHHEFVPHGWKQSADFRERMS